MTILLRLCPEVIRVAARKAAQGSIPWGEAARNETYVLHRFALLGGLRIVGRGRRAGEPVEVFGHVIQVFLLAAGIPVPVYFGVYIHRLSFDHSLTRLLDAQQLPLLVLEERVERGVGHDPFSQRIAPDDGYHVAVRVVLVLREAGDETRLETQGQIAFVEHRGQHPAIDPPVFLPA